MGPAPSRVPAGVWFAAWAAVGGGTAFALLGVMTVGVFLAPVVVLLVVVLLRVDGSARGRPGLLVGAAVPFGWVAYLNRDGPGEVCRVTAQSTSCVEEWSPWPWCAISVALVVVGVLLFLRSRRGVFGAE